MQVNNQALSLFHYLDNQAASEKGLSEAVDRQKTNYVSELSSLNAGISSGNFDTMLSEIEKGKINIELGTVSHYIDFNMQKLNRELQGLAQSFGVTLPVEVGLEDGELTVKDDSSEGETLQAYLDKDSRLNKLVSQTDKLSRFYEWGRVREHASSYQSENVKDDDLLAFLKEGRERIVHNNSLFITHDGPQYLSQQQTDPLIKKYDEKFGLANKEQKTN